LSEFVLRYARTSHERKIFFGGSPSPWITPALVFQIVIQDQFGKYRTFHEPVIRYVAVRMRNRDAFPDLVQDAFTAALEELPHALLDVRGWFIIQAAQACTRHDWSRRRYTRAAYNLHEHASRSGAAASTGLAEAHRRPGRVTFVHAMARLTPGQRRAIQLRYLDLRRHRRKSSYAVQPVMPLASWNSLESTDFVGLARHSGCQRARARALSVDQSGERGAWVAASASLVRCGWLPRVQLAA